MEREKVALVPLEESDRNRFVLDNQRAFKYGATEEFGVRDEHFEEDGEIISRKTIEDCIDARGAEAYRIVADGRTAGGAVLEIDPVTHINELVLLFVNPELHGLGIGGAAWREIERLHPETEVWKTCTPYFEKRNIHFYINKCGFHAVEFFCAQHPDSCAEEGVDEMFAFEKVMSKHGG